MDDAMEQFCEDSSWAQQEAEEAKRHEESIGWYRHHLNRLETRYGRPAVCRHRKSIHFALAARHVAEKRA